MRTTTGPTIPSLLALLALAGACASSARAYDTRHIFVTNRGAGTILELDESLALVRTWFASEGLDEPNGMAFTPDGAIWVADTGNLRILAFDAAGTRAGTIDTATRLGSSVESIYFAGDGTLFATANPGLGVIARYTITGSPLPDVVDAPAFLNLGNVNLTNAGNVIVSDFSGTMRGLRELDPATGTVMRAFGTDLGRQEDVMIDGADRVFVSHFDGDEIVVYDAARTELYRFAPPPSEPMPLDQPTGIALTHDCRILVASFANAVLFEFRHRGDSPPQFVRSVRIDGLSLPESIAIAGLALPGGFSEFADAVPTCNPVVRPDGGPPMPDAGASDAGSGGPDAGMSLQDAGARDAGSGPGMSGGCGCIVPCGSDSERGVLVAFVLGLCVLGLGRRRRLRMR